MRQKDLPIIIVAAFFAAVISFLLTNYVIAPSSERVERVEVIEPITAEFNTVDERYFNDDSINPTRVIEIGGGSIDADGSDEDSED